MDIGGSVCIVTGASSGIGAATARLLAGRGASVVLAARRADRLDALAAQLPRALAVPTDVTVREQLEHLVDRAHAEFGRVDVLVNNAGQGLHVPLLDIDPEDLRAVFELNVVAPLVAMQLVLPLMRAQARGSIVNVSSATSLRLFPGLGGYAATKSALNLLSEIARIELEPAGVTVSVVYPAATATEFHQNLRAGSFVPGSRRMVVDPAELVAEAIAVAIESGEAHLLVGEPPRPITLGNPDIWAAMQARMRPAAPAGGVAASTGEAGETSP